MGRDDGGAGDRGLDSPRAWLTVAAAFAALATTFGIAYSFGAFVGAIRADLGASRAAGAALFSVTALIWFGLGGLTGAAADRFGPRPVLFTGAVALGAGLLLTAQAGSIEVAVVVYGLGVGIGVACAYVPTVALVGAWFERRRTLALGVAVSGIGVGTLAVPPAAAALIDAVGWREAYRVLALLGVVVLGVCACVIAPAPRDDRADGARLGQAVRTADYAWLYLAGLLSALALYVPFVYLPDYAEERGVDPVEAAGLIGAIGMASVLGRLALGALADRIGLLRTYQACFVLMSSSFVLWLVAGSHLVVMVAFAAVLGTGYGGFVALTPAVVARRFGVTGLGALLGALYTGVGLGSAVGPVAAGAAIDAAGYDTAIVGALAVGALAFFASLPLSSRTHAPDLVAR